MMKILARVLALGMILFVVLAASACQSDEEGEVSLESMRTALVDAGYAIIQEDLESDEYAPDNLVGGFVFTFPGAHGAAETPVLEFADNASALAYAEIVNANGHWVAIINDNFLTIAHAHHGVPHENERVFFENLLNGRGIE